MPKHRPAPSGLPDRAVTSAKEPVSRILSCAVIPLGAASPRTLISNLPGGSGNSSNRLSRTGPMRLAARFLGLRRVPPYLVLLRVGFTMPRVLRRERCALTAPFHPYPGATGACSHRAAELSRESPGSRGGIFSVALAVFKPLRLNPGRYPAHRPAEFGLSSPGTTVASHLSSTGSDRPAPLLSLVYLESLPA